MSGLLDALRGDVLVADGAMGSMIARSLPRSGPAAMAHALLDVNLVHPEIVQSIHMSYIAAGANIITLFYGGKGGIQGIVNMAYLSSLRTGAATGVAAKYLAPADSKVLGIIGPGWQATFQVEAILETCNIEQVVVWGRTPKRRKDFVKQMSKVVKVDWKEVDSIDECEGLSDSWWYRPIRPRRWRAATISSPKCWSPPSALTPQ